MGAQAAGQRAFELNEQGKSAGEALGRGTVSGIIEAATEKLPLERMAEILHSGGANAVKNILRQMGTEATEEGASYFLNYVSDLAAADPDAKFSLAELAQSAAGGAFGGLVFGTAGTVGAKLAQRNEGGVYDDTAYERDVVRSLQDADAQLRAARSLPEGAGREAAVNAAQEKMSQTIADFVGQQAAESAERSAAYDADPNGRMSLAQRAQAAEWEQQHTTSIDTNPATHTPEQMEKIHEYVNSVDEGLKEFIQKRRNGELWKKAKYTVGNVDARTQTDIKNAIGIDANGYKIVFDVGSDEHIVRRHGAEGQASRSMSEIEDIARLPYVVQNYDTLTDLQDTTIKVNNRDNSPAKIIKLAKQVDGTYFVVEAVPDSARKEINIISAYMQKAAQQAPGVQASGHTSKTALANAASEQGINQTLDGRLQLPGLLSDDTLVAYSIRQNAGNSNTSAANIPLSEAMQYGKTPEQAMMEAKAKAEGERTRQVREEQAAAEQQERLDRITNGKSRDIMQRVYEAQERAERVASRHALERATTRATTADADSYIDHTQEDIAIDLVNSLESERRFLTNLRNGWHLSDAELVNAERMAAGRGPVTEMDSHRYELVETYARAMRQYNEDMQPYYAFQRGLDDARLRRATELIKDSDNWKDSRGNLGLQIRTPERVLRKVMGDTAETEAIYQAYFAPIFKHDAEAIRWENSQRERLKGIMERPVARGQCVYPHEEPCRTLSEERGHAEAACGLCEGEQEQNSFQAGRECHAEAV